MRFGTVADRLVLVNGEAGGTEPAGEPGSGQVVVDVATASDGRFGPDPMTAYEQWDALVEWATIWEVGGGREPRRAATPTDGAGAGGPLGPPVPRPRQVFALALNYPMHAAEARLDTPADPLVFTKFPSCLVGPDATVTLPSDHVDWEVELVVAIGRGGHRIPAEEAWRHVAGLTIGQDLSERRVQLAGQRPQFSLGKSFPGFGPTGPVLVTPDELPDPSDLELSGTLRSADGETVVQHARTCEMVFPIPELVARISAICPLLPGDLVFTGTPAGVGYGRDPRRYLRPGDVLLSRVEGIGELRTNLA